MLDGEPRYVASVERQVGIHDDTVSEEDETFALQLTRPGIITFGVTLPDAPHVVTILDDDNNNFATGAPTITGTVQVGEVLTATSGGITDADGKPANAADYTYQWLDGGDDTPITAATGMTYTPVVGDEGKTLKVKVSFTDGGGNPEERTSDATAAVAAATKLTDATLSGLGLAGATLSDPFASDTTTYMESVANTVTQITLAPTTTDDGASIEYFDGSDMALIDASGTDNGFQVNLAVGANVIKVKVTAEDGTTQTYTLTVTREAGNAAPTFGEGGTAGRRVAENTATETDFGAALTATDTDSDTLTYGLDGTDAASFDIDTGTGQLKTNVALNFENKTRYTVDVTVTDGKNAGGATDSTVDATITVTINVDNVDEAAVVTFTGTPEVGTPLTATLSDPDGGVTGTAWLWSRSASATGTFTNIAGATNARYTPVAGDAAMFLKTTASYTDTEGSGKSATSAASGAVRAGGTSNEGALRLVDGDTAADGILEVFYDGRWGTVCDDTIDYPGNIAPEMACQFMGYETGTFTGNRGMNPDPTTPFTGGNPPGSTIILPSTHGDQPIWLDDVRCYAGSTHWGNSAPENLSQCYNAGWGLHNCVHAEDVKLECTGTSESQTEQAPLTAAFEDLPSSHDGSSAFKLRLAFSEAIAVAGYRTVRDELLEVTGGTVTGAGRLAPRLDNGQADNRLWEVMVQPGSEGRVTIALAPGRACGETGAVCTADGRALSEGVAVGIPGPEAPLEFLTAVADGATLILTYDELLDESGTPPASAFTVTVGGAARAVDAVSVAGRAVTLTLAFAVTARDAVTVSYTVPEGPEFLRDTLGTIAASFGARAVTVNTVAAAPVTAWFFSVPPEHDGSTAFRLSLAFSEEPRGLSYRTVRDRLFAVTGATVTGAGRLAPPSNLRYQLTVVPFSDAPVTLSLAALPACGAPGSVCTADGRALSGSLSKMVPGPAALVVADATVREGPGAKLAFAVTLDRARHAPVSVRYASTDGTATAGEDYSAASGTLTFAAGETEQTVEVTVLDDAHDEGSETLTLALSNASGARIADATATGTIVNRDPLPKAWMVRFGRTVGSQVVEGLTGRLQGASGSHVTVGGIELTGGGAFVEPEPPSGHTLGLTGWTTGTEREPQARTMTADELLLGSAFHLSSAGAESGGPTFTAWGRVATGGFDADVDHVTIDDDDNGETRGLEGAIDGDVTTGLIGFDAEWNRALAGLMLSQSTGEGSYRLGQSEGQDGTQEGTVESTLTSVYPYASMDLNARVSAWAIAGMGSGELTLKPKNRVSMPTDLSMRMGAAGVKGRVLDGGAGGLSLNVRSDALWVSMENDATDELAGTEGDVSRLRLILEGERAFEVNEGATFTPSAEVGLRHDGGDAETGTGLEVGAGVRYTAGALTIEGRVRALVAHEDSGYEEWGASGALRIAPSQSGRGLALPLSPTWGRTGSGTGQLWSGAHASGLDRGGDDFEAQSGLDAELGYGFGLTGARDVLAPYAGLSLGDAGSRRIRLGTQWRLAPEATVTLEATREDRRDEAPTDALMLRGRLRF